jgi:IPT/TIG domain
MTKQFLILLLFFVVMISGCKDMGSNVPPTPVVPTIAGIQPDSAAVGDTVMIGGYNFGSSQGSSSVLFAPGISANIVVSWSDSLIVVGIPAGAVSGNVSVTVNGSASNAFQFKSSAAAPDTLVHFQTGILPILLNNCALSGCHSGSSPISGFNASTYDNLRKGGFTFGDKVITPGDSTTSDIMLMIRSSNNPIGLRMPQGGPYASTGLPDSLIVRIGKWIQQGALNN